MKFRLPRKLKKRLKKIMFFHAMGDGDWSLMAFPSKSQEDYNAYKQGKLVSPFNFTKKQLKEKKRVWNETYRVPCEFTDEELVNAVNDIFADEYVEQAINTFRRAKKHPIAIVDYYEFCNAYKLGKTNIACMTLDGAKMNLKKKL